MFGEMKKANILSILYALLYRHVNMRVSACSIFPANLQNDERGADVRVTTAAVY